METRTVERTVETTGFDPESPALYSVRWAAVIAGLAVGLGVHLLLMLIGVAAGLAVFGSGERPDGSSISVAAAVWNSVSLFIAAAIGGYIAARSSGLRRTADGMLHAVASWGASMICYAFIVTAITGNTLGSMFGVAATSAGLGIGSITANSDANATMTELLASIERGDRGAASRLMRDRFGMSADQADRAVDRAMAMMGRGGTPGAVTPEGVNQAAQAASAASAWLALVILLSLAAGAAGGVVGIHGTRKRALDGGYRHRRVIMRNHAGEEGLPHAS